MKARRAPDDRAYLFVGTSKGAYVYESDYDRETWKRTGAFLTGREVVNFVFDYREGRSVYAVSASDGVWLTHDLGRNWEQAGAVDGASAYSTIALGYDAESLRLYAGVAPCGLAVSRDAGHNWEDVLPLPGKEGLAPASLFVHPSSPQDLCVALPGAGVYRSEDGGGKWIEAQSGLEGEAARGEVYRFASSPARPDTLFAAAADGLYRSDDAAESWRRLVMKDVDPGGGAVAVSLARPSLLFVVPKQDRGGLGIYRSRDGGEDWERLRLDPEENSAAHVAPRALVIDDCDEEGVYVGTQSGKIYVGRDEGETWEPIVSGLPPVRALEPVVLLA